MISSFWLSAITPSLSSSLPLGRGRGARSGVLDIRCRRLKSVPDYYRGHRIDVEFGYSFAESGGFEISPLHYDHLFLRKELENLAYLPLDHSRSVLMSVEGSPEELIQALLGLRVACCDGR